MLNLQEIRQAVAYISCKLVEAQRSVRQTEQRVSIDLDVFTPQHKRAVSMRIGK